MPNDDTRKRYTLAELLAQCEPNTPLTAEDRAWLDMAPVGREFGSPDYERLAQLDVLADTAKAAADRASDSVGATVRFCEESNHRIEALEAGKEKP